eukprot:CAMPEP_0172503880 /NCGR_PEP_ID=MMETSP1066-20121228/173311_1 /TAXON_ID=671091 /ORGANISM="Coscinodiscus wailesii, Strain CCMP2513" /LENGTH=101 /DNA_ID=CAMNT_0013279807 /DNA_START=168 /DNA_END=469 /DNA_ORIENTATION=+
MSCPPHHHQPPVLPPDTTTASPPPPSNVVTLTSTTAIVPAQPIIFLGIAAVMTIVAATVASRTILFPATSPTRPLSTVPIRLTSRPTRMMEEEEGEGVVTG